VIQLTRVKDSAVVYAFQQCCVANLELYNIIMEVFAKQNPFQGFQGCACISLANGLL